VRWIGARDLSGEGKVTISNTRYSQIGDGLVMVGSTIYNASSGNVAITNVQKY
jgi:hypothetical protein